VERSIPVVLLEPQLIPLPPPPALGRPLAVRPMTIKSPPAATRSVQPRLIAERRAVRGAGRGRADRRPVVVPEPV